MSVINVLVERCYTKELSSLNAREPNLTGARSTSMTFACVVKSKTRKATMSSSGTTDGKNATAACFHGTQPDQAELYVEEAIEEADTQVTATETYDAASSLATRNVVSTANVA